MKNILKKIGVLGLIIAVLSPFIDLPKVNAATDGCTNHLQYYLFLDANAFIPEGEKTFFEGYTSKKQSGGYQTYANFPYRFPDTSTNDVTIKSVKEYNFNSDNLSNISIIWDALKDVNKGLTSKEIDSESGNILVTEPKLSGYEDTTIILHGEWSSFDAGGEPIDNGSWSDVDPSTGEERSIQKLLESDDLAKLTTTFDPATYKNNRFGLSNDTLNADYFQNIVDNGSSTWEDNSGKYIALGITRTVDLSTDKIKEMLNEYVFGYYNDESSSYMVFSTTDPSGDISKVTNSYSAFIDPDGETYGVGNSATGIDFLTNQVYYWPAVLSVEYTSCPKTSSTWAIKYDDNVDDTSVTNMPEPITETADMGKSITVSSTIPKRDGYVFKGWCESKNGNGDCYEAGKTVASPSTATTISLYAQWAKSGTADNPKQGVVSYIIGFAAVGVVAGGIYLISKKKNLFKQI